MHKRKNEHVCNQKPSSYIIRPIHDIYTLSKPDFGSNGADICGLISIKFCPWCGEEL